MNSSRQLSMTRDVRPFFW